MQQAKKSNLTSPGAGGADGLIIVDKPTDWTSHDVVAKARGICGTRRIGHTGTLDPFATGVLVLCINRATRLVQFLTLDEKEYIARIRFGFATDTGDLTGVALDETATEVTGTPFDVGQSVTTGRLADVLRGFVGRYAQTPPMYSAKKVGGKRLYELARQGEVIERSPVEVEISEIELIGADDVNPDVVTIRVVCSSGTYVRVLAEDIGKKLGVGAHLTGLRRTRVGRFSISEARSLEELEQMSVEGRLQEAFVGMAEALQLPVVVVDSENQRALFNGRSISWVGDVGGATRVKVSCDGRLVAIAEYDQSDSILRPRVVFN